MDGRGSAWIVRDFKVGRRSTPLWRCVLMTIFPQWDDIIYEVELLLEPQPPLSFQEIQARVCRSIEMNQDEWIDDGAMAGESGEPVTLEQLMTDAKVAVRSATDIESLREALNAAIRRDSAAA